jgi:hypothetical protein
MIMMIDTDVLDVAEDGGSTDLLSWPLVIELLETNGLPTTRTATGSKGCCKAARRLTFERDGAGTIGSKYP